MDSILATIDQLERYGFAPRDILAAIRAQARQELAERDRYEDEAEARAEYEARHGAAVPF